MTTLKFPHTAICMLVVIDHQEAKIYRTESTGSSAERIIPYDPHGYGRHLHSAREWTDGNKIPESKSYYEAIAKTLQVADEIVIFGNGDGKSSAKELLLADLKAHHSYVSAKIVGTVSVDTSHASHSQLLARARELFTTCKA